MMYCVGHTTTYRKLLKEHEQKGLNLKKLGVRDVTDNFPDGYHGGGAFPSAKDALDFIKYTGYEGKRSVFEMDGDYDTDTYQIPGEPFRRIITDKIIFREVTAEEISDKNDLIKES